MAERSSAVKVMRCMAESPHSSNSCSAIVLRKRRQRARVSSYAASSIHLLQNAVRLEDFFKKRGVQSGAQAFAGKAVLARMSLQHHQCQLTEQPKVGRPLPVFHTVAVLAKRHLDLPMQAIRDAPVPTHGLSDV